MKKLMLATLALAAAFTLTADNYTPSSIPSGLTEPDVTPGEINYQGILRNPKNGNLYTDGIYTLECRIYSQASGGTPLWGASYSAYVKDGYFNLMLGTTGASLSGCTYGPTSLWKALWYTTGRRELYLGVTPCQDADNHPIQTDDKKEILPRQKLLTAPFAFRAQKAQYADAAPGNFNVGGNLEVAGNVTVASGKKLTLKNIAASDSDVKIGNSSTSPATTTLQGSKVTIESGSALNVNSHGNTTMTMDTGKWLYLNGGSVKASHSSATVKTSLYTELDAKELILKGDVGVDISSNHGIGLNDGVADGLIVGDGNLQWRGSSSRLRIAPFYIKSVSVTIPAHTLTKRVDIESLCGSSFAKYVKDYRWYVGGYEATGSGADWLQNIYVDNNTQYGSIAPYLNITTANPDGYNKSRTIKVHLVGVANYWCIDDRD